MDNLAILVEAPVFNLQLLVDGVLIGALFALAAYGMALVWGVLRIINIAQGEFVMLGGYVVVYAAAAGMPPLAAVPLAAAALYLLGWLLYRLVIFRVVDQDLFTSILATFGLSIVLQQLANQLFGANVRSVDAGLGTLLLADGRISVPYVKLVAFAACAVLGVVLMRLLKSTRFGQAVRATAQNARAARILGVDTDHVYAATFALNAAICGAAGALVAMTWVIHPYFGLAYTVRAFMIVVVAGLGNLAGIIASGAGLGVAEQYAGFVLGAEFQTAFLFGLLVAILVARQLALRRRRQYLR
ncbi:MAG: branched-chain amino acid ABC transporter permease [Betaproteobacteria bacterium]|nr:MAG: branched-chain amino acid ABC transporter permease [Betaproteobacteria bacterium]